MYNCFRGANFLFGAFIIVFTFIMWTPTKWIVFGIGVWLVLHGLIDGQCFCKSCNTPSETKPKIKRKK